MSAQNKAIARRVFEEVFNGGRLELMDQLAAADLAVHYASAAEPVRGLERYKEVYAESAAAFPDAQYRIEDVVAEGDRVVTRWTMRATHQGAYQGLAATGKACTVSGISIYRIADGRVGEAWVCSDDLGLFQQLGVVPLLASAAA